MSITISSKKKKLWTLNNLRTSKKGERKDNNGKSGGSDLVEELLHNSHSRESSHRLNGFQFRYEFQVTLKLDSSSSVRKSETIGDMRCLCLIK